MRTHGLKVWPEFFTALKDGSKTFEIRKDDRGFAVGDALCLREWDPTPFSERLKYDAKGYTGRVLTKVVSYKFPGGRMGIPEGVCVLGFRSPSPDATGGGADPGPKG